MKQLSLLLTGTLILLWLAGSAGAQRPGISAPAGTDAALGSGFTYQGRLQDSGAPLDGLCDFRFSLWDALNGGTQIGASQTINGASVSDGLFTLTLNGGNEFGATAFTGQARWLEVSVRCAGDVAFIKLSPRQPLTAAPYALSLRPGASINGTVVAGGALTLSNSDALGMGLLVGSANHGVYVLSATTNGLVVDAAGWNGLLVSAAGNDGVHVISADNDGLAIDAAGWNGLLVSAAGNNGVHVASANNVGLYVASAGAAGLRVADSAVGVEVDSASTGVLIGTTTVDGVEVFSAGGSGLYVDSADESGVYVGSANSGVYVNNAVTGLAVNSASGDGLFIDTAVYGIYENSVDTGLFVAAAGKDGVQATSTSASYYGGEFFNNAAGGSALYARGGSNTAADLVLGGSSGTNDDGRIFSDPAYSGSDIFLISNDAVQIELDNDNNESGDLWLLNGAGTTVLSVNESGDLTALGTKSAAVQTAAYGVRKLYAVESPENWFEDFGTARLANGMAVVIIEPIFAQTVNLDQEYHLFLTPLGDCPLYVAEKTPLTFTVKAMGGLACDVAFDYRLVAKRLGYEGLRLEAAPELSRAPED